MLYRCYDENNKSYKNYGARGIGVDPSWLLFENFYRDMGEPENKNLSLDRINNNGNYEKNNCKWSTSNEQQRNRRTTIKLTINEITKTAKEWSLDPRCSISYLTILRRIKDGYSHHQAVFLNKKNRENYKKSKKNYYIKINGIEKTIRQWSLDGKCHIPYPTIMSRISKGIDPIKAIFERNL